MKKIILPLIMVALAFTSCKKNEAKVEQPKEEMAVEAKSPERNFNYRLEWTAFKTPEKVGVKGTFNTISISDFKNSGDLEQDLKDATFTIDTASINSSDAGRDAKLRDGFFGLLTGNISGKFIDFKDGKATVEIKMNDVSVQKEFAYTTTETSLKLNGTIDIISDFKGDKAFNSIHELCKDLHLGKTWTDVAISVEFTKL